MAFSSAELGDIYRFCGYPPDIASAWVQSDGFAKLETLASTASDTTIAVVRTTYLPALYTMESALDACAANMDVQQAAVYIHNANEYGDRQRQLNDKRRGLCAIFSVPPGPGLSGGRVIRT